eukprot:gene18745-25272_t
MHACYSTGYRGRSRSSSARKSAISEPSRSNLLTVHIQFIETLALSDTRAAPSRHCVPPRISYFTKSPSCEYFNCAPKRLVRIRQLRMETCVSALPSGKLSGLLEVVRLTCEEGFELGQLMTDTRLHDARRKRDSEKGKLQSSRQHVSQLLPSSGPSVPRPPPDKAPAYKPPTAAGGKLLLGGPCESCGATESPQWRRPDPTRVLLCNRCGIHYGRYKKLPGKRHQHEGSVLASAKTGTPGVSMKRKSHDSRSESDVEQPSRQVPRPYSGPSPGLSHALPQASPGSANNAPRSDERPIPVRPAKPGFPLSGMERQATWSYGRLIDHPGGKNNGSSHGGEENSVSQEVYLKSLNWQQQQLLAGLASSDPATSEDDGSQDNAHQKKYALQKKLRVFSNQRSEAFAPPQSSRDSTHDYGASFSGHSTYQPGHAPPGHSAHPHPLFQPQVSHAANSDEFGIGAGGNRRSASQPAQQHYILQNEVLMSFDGSPVDSATYNNVLGSLLQQQRQLL